MVARTPVGSLDGFARTGDWGGHRPTPDYVYGIATMGHVRPIYLDVAILIVGTVLARRAFAS